MSIDTAEGIKLAKYAAIACELEHYGKKIKDSLPTQQLIKKYFE